MAERVAETVGLRSRHRGNVSVYAGFVRLPATLRSRRSAGVPIRTPSTLLLANCTVQRLQKCIGALILPVHPSTGAEFHENAAEALRALSRTVKHLPLCLHVLRQRAERIKPDEMVQPFVIHGARTRHTKLCCRLLFRRGGSERTSPSSPRAESHSP